MLEYPAKYIVRNGVSIVFSCFFHIICWNGDELKKSLTGPDS